MAKIKATHLNSEESATYKPTQYGVYGFWMDKS